MNIEDFAKHILLNEKISDKILLGNDIQYNPIKYHNFKFPGRSKNITFSKKRIKFPPVNQLYHNEKKALALHFFANHELLAIELLAWAIIRFPFDIPTQKVLVNTIKDEQKHFLLYDQRINELDISFGDYPLNSFFWNIITQSKSKEQFYALIALTFEQANLDFSSYFRDIFKQIGDIQTSNIMDIVYQDEIKHVNLGRLYLNAHLPVNKTLFHYYKSLLPEKITPSRAKGVHFNDNARTQSGFDKLFIQNIKQFNDNFSVTNRKRWKI